MIISHRHRFIFVKTMKTAGSSVEAALAPHCGPEDVITPIFPEIQGHAPRNHRGWFWPVSGIEDLRDLRQDLSDLRHRRKFYNHIPARVARARLPSRVWSDYFVFCIERNPWDKTLSHYHMFKNARWHGRYDPSLTIDRYLDNGVLCRNIDIYCDPDRKILVDRVIRYESFQDEIREVFKMLDLPVTELKHEKANLRADRRCYRDVLTEVQAARIADAFGDEISLHGWSY